jgi:hypothetical protein
MLGFNRINRISDSAAPKDADAFSLIFRILIPVSSLTIFFSLFISNYTSFSLLQNISYLTDDGWCLRKEPRVGIHCFGDFGLPIQQILTDRNVWSLELPSNYTPLVTIVFGELGKIMELFGWNAAFVLYSLMITVPIWIVIFIALSSLDSLRRLALGCFLAFLSTPILITLDRGNSVGLIVFPLYMFFKKLQRDSSFGLIWWGSIAISIRPQCALILILLLFCKRYLDLIGLLVSTIFAYFVAFLLWDNSNILENFVAFLKTLLGYANQDIGTLWPYNYSFSNAIGIWNRALDFGIANSLVGFSGAFLGLMAILCVWQAGQRIKLDNSTIQTLNFVWLLPFGYLLPSISYGYYTCFALLSLIVIIDNKLTLKQLGYGSEFLGVIFASVLTITVSLFSLPIGPIYTIGRVNLVQSLICGIWIIPYLILSSRALGLKKIDPNILD